jgi:hypothetical protein
MSTTKVSAAMQDDIVASDLPAGSIVQVVSASSVAATTGTTLMPSDDTIPQNTEGDEYFTATITPTSATNKLSIICTWAGSSTLAGQSLTMALFQDSTAGALNVQHFVETGANYRGFLVISHFMTTGTVSATTFKIRVGGGSAGTNTMHGYVAGTRLYGGIWASGITITEIQV